MPQSGVARTDVRPRNNSKQIYDENVIEQYNNRALSQQQNVGEKHTVILYNHIKPHAGLPNTETKGTIS